MVDLVHQLREDAKTASADSLRVMCGWGADEIERLRGVAAVAADLVALWQAQRVAGLPRSARNAAIEESRERLIKALVEIEYHQPEKNADATARAVLALTEPSE